ncbi:hypothetical protein AB4068_11275 [Arthrobacter sp. 2RAF22]|uniref:hypothetical protein n=1 Tax=Arthrobacter sp. 2RAF22 TaxID=3232996 RepID=UPI003F8DA875
MNDSQEHTHAALTARIKRVPMKVRVIGVATALCLAGFAGGAAFASVAPRQEPTNAAPSEQSSQAVQTKPVQTMVICEDARNRGLAFSGTSKAC